MRRLVLFVATSLVIANAAAQTTQPDVSAIQSEIKRLQESLPKPYSILKPWREYGVVCTHGGNLVERWYDGPHIGYTTLQLYHLPEARPKLCDPKTGQVIN